MVDALSIMSSTKQLSLQHLAKWRFTLGWLNIISNLGRITISFLSNIASIYTTLYYQSTSGTWKTITPTFRSSGPLSREQALTGETHHAASFVWRKSSAYYQLTDLLSWTKDLNLLPSADTKTSSTRPIKNRIAPTVLHELSLNCMPPTSNGTVWWSLCAWNSSNCPYGLYL